jgi:hypothetical protein
MAGFVTPSAPATSSSVKSASEALARKRRAIAMISARVRSRCSALRRRFAPARCPRGGRRPGFFARFTLVIDRVTNVF